MTAEQPLQQVTSPGGIAVTVGVGGVSVIFLYRNKAVSLGGYALRLSKLNFIPRAGKLGMFGSPMTHFHRQNWS